jgi:hypothetical protein
MGEFINAIGTYNITGKVSTTPNGQKSMKSIKPKLGKGLGKINDKNSGKIFPQFITKNGKILDSKFSLKPILVLSEEIKKNFSSKLNLVNSKEIKDLNKFFKKTKCKAVIVRPDRFILSSCKSVKDFKSYLIRNLYILA